MLKLIYLRPFRFLEDPSESSLAFRNFHDSDIDGVMLGTQATWIYLNTLHAPYRQLLFTKDRLYMVNIVIYFQKKSALIDTCNVKLRIFGESGLTQYWVSNYVDDRKMKSKDYTQMKLDTVNIFGALQICVVIYLCGFVVFVLEVISVRISCLKRTLEYLTY